MRTASERTHILTGAAVVVVLAAAMVLSYAGDVGRARIGYDLYANFRNIDGLAVGAEVRLAGLIVGTVTAQEFVSAGQQARVTMTITRNYPIPTDSAAMIVSDSLLGSKFVKIEPGGDETSLEDGDEFLYVQNSVILEDVLDRLIREVEATRERRARVTD